MKYVLVVFVLNLIFNSLMYALTYMKDRSLLYKLFFILFASTIVLLSFLFPPLTDWLERKGL